MDLFRNLDHDGGMQMSVKEFAEGLRIGILDADNDGEIDYTEFDFILSSIQLSKVRLGLE